MKKIRSCQAAILCKLSKALVKHSFSLRVSLKRKPDYVVLYVGTNNAKDLTSREILDKLPQLNTAVLDSDENCKVILSQPMIRVDDGKAYSTILKLNDLLEELDIPILKDRNITVDHLESKDLHFNSHGTSRFAMNLKASIRKF